MTLTQFQVYDQYHNNKLEKCTNIETDFLVYLMVFDGVTMMLNPYGTKNLSQMMLFARGRLTLRYWRERL
jgi:hypothetical protein